MVDHDRIWLSPRCTICVGNERMWCQNNEWAEGCDPPECALMPAEYVRADLAVAPPADVAATDSWQPIATAPRDGTVIDLWFAGQWNKRMCDFAWRGKYWFTDDRVGAYNHDPNIITHWRPLPPGPKETGDEG